jgi:diguanylate cyclase (GGDEF)-like protein
MNQPPKRYDASTLLDCVEDAILVLDGQLRVRYANAALAPFLSPRDPGVGEADPDSSPDPLSVVHPDDLDRVVVELAAGIESGAARTTIGLRIRDGQGWRPVAAVVNNLLDDELVEALVVSFRNLTNEVQLQASLDIQLELARQNRALQKQLTNRQRFLNRLIRIQSSISGRAPLQEVLNAVVAGASQLIADDVAVLCVADPADPSRLVMAGLSGIDDAQLASRVGIAVETGIGAEAFRLRRRSGAVVHSGARFAETDPQLAALGYHTSLAVPIRHGRNVVGSLSVVSARQRRRYTETEQEVLGALADHAGLALMDAHMVESMRVALTDELTGLPNRRLLMERLDASIESCALAHEEISLLFVDLDGFKSINDWRGHEVGDAVLAAVGARLTEIAGPQRTVARLGGDEFVVVLEASSGAQAAAVAESVLEAVRRPIEVGDWTGFVDATIGHVTAAAGQRCSGSTLVRRADIAMYHGKVAGRGRMVAFDPSLEEAVAQRAELETELRTAIRSGAITVEYQPVVGLGGVAVRGVEALARWTSASQGVVPPTVFVALAERLGLAAELDRIVLRQACADVRMLVDAGSRSPLPLHVNLAPAHLESPSVVDTLIATLDDVGFDPQRLIIELTEASAMNQPEAGRERLEALQRRGIRVALDDFGTGYSSLSHLERFPINMLKIDRAFVDRLHHDRRSRQLTESIVNLAHTLDMQVVAEGIEAVEQAEILTAIGVDAAQGFHFARPMTADALRSLDDVDEMD